MGTGSLTRIDLYSLFDIYQNTLLKYSKDLVISALRETFSRDSYFHCQLDKFGNVKKSDHDGLNLADGVKNDKTTRLFIGEKYPHTGIFYPALLISGGGAKCIPISFNRDRYEIQYETLVFEDGYGRRKLVSNPAYFKPNGAYEFSINVDIQTKDTNARDELHDILLPYFTDLEFENFQKAGLVIKNVSSNGPSEKDDRNAKIYMTTITLDCRGEFERRIPISSTLDKVSFCIDVANNLDVEPPDIAPNLQIKFDINLNQLLKKLLELE